MERKHIRLGTIVIILATAGWIMGTLAEQGDVIGYTTALVITTIVVAAAMAILGPSEGADERAVRRSEEAALSAVRLAALMGMLGAAYANMLDMREAAVLSVGMIIPGLLWIVFYLILNWRDTH